MASDLAYHGELMHALAALHLGGKYSDLTIACNARRWPVHRAIVCSQSGFFDACMSHDCSENQSGLIDLSDDDEHAVEQMIHYLYHHDYLNQPAQQPSALFRHRAYSSAARKRLSDRIDFSQIEDPLLAQANAYNGSDQAFSPPPSPTAYHRKSLSLSPKRNRSLKKSHRTSLPTPPIEIDRNFEHRSQADDEYEDASSNDEDDLDNDGNNEVPSTEAESHLLLHAHVYALADKYDIPGLKSLAAQKFESAMACYYDAPEFAAAISEAYANTSDTDRGLRNVVLSAFRAHPPLASTGDVYNVIKDTPELALDLYKMERGILS